MLARGSGKDNELILYQSCPPGAARLSDNPASWCFKCPNYAVQARQGADRCDFCTTGKTVVGGLRGLVGHGTCVPCPVGRYRDQTEDTCALCPRGKFSGGGGQPCQDCKGQNIVRSSMINGEEFPRASCAPCGAGEGPSASRDQCLPCTGNTFSTL